MLVKGVLEEDFEVIDASIDEIEYPDPFAAKYWHIEISHVMMVATEAFMHRGLEEILAKSLTTVDSLRDLTKVLEDKGLEPDLDPVEIQTTNSAVLKRLLSKLRQMTIAWSLRGQTSLGLRVHGVDDLLNRVLVADKNDIYLELWDESRCLQKVAKTVGCIEQGEFIDSFAVSETLAELLMYLELSQEELEAALPALEKQRRRKEVEKQFVQVAGKPFQNTEDNLEQLWEHIAVCVDDNRVIDLQLDDSLMLEELGRKKRSKKRKGKEGGKAGVKQRKTISQAMKKLIGVAEEIHAYRVLQRSYGVEYVGPSNRKSENSLYLFPKNKVDDGLGCDFIIQKDGKTYYLEVKATQGSDEMFELGSSEMRLAIELAKERKKQFRIIHILDALSETPEMGLFSNPYNRAHKSNYVFEKAGMRVRYVLS